MAKITEYLDIILEGRDLTFEQAKSLLDTIFEGEVAPVQIASFLAAMRVKKAAVAELAGLASSLREHAVSVDPKIDNLVDTCGTGGALLKTFNISTAAAFVTAGGGAYVAKHGNRGITSKCGSADVLLALGVNIDPGPAGVEKCIREAHIGFMFAPKFHPAMKHVQPIRQELDFRTAFNILGPLASPAKATAQVMGVGDAALLERVAETLKMLGVRRAMVVHSEGLDEISTMGPTRVLDLKNDTISELTIHPSDHGMQLATFEDLKGGDAQTNASIVRDILEGKDAGPRKDIVVLNAAAAILVAGLVDSLDEGIKAAEASIRDGKALTALEKLIAISNK